MSMRELTEIEKKTYDFIKQAGEIQTTNMPNKRMQGALSNLKNLGLVEFFKKYTSYYRSSKKKFVRIREREKD